MLNVAALRAPAAQTALYGTRGRPGGEAMGTVALTAIPYYAWANREPADMQVWLREWPARG